MGGATVVPKDILETIKGKDINIQLNMGGYTWTINGKDVTASDLKDINMEVKFNTNAVPSETVKKLAGDNPTQQLSLTHEGDFGFKATLTMNAGAEYAGKHGNLFWYDSNHKMVFIDAGENPRRRFCVIGFQPRFRLRVGYGRYRSWRQRNRYR